MISVIKIAVVDNDKEVLDLIGDYLSLYSKENNVIYSLDKFDNEIEFLEKNEKYSILFLDINMPYKNGIDVAKEIRSRNDDVVICIITNYSQYAIAGYEVNAFDFILKNQPYDVFKVHLKRLCEHAELLNKKSISITSNYKKYKLNAKDIMYVESNGHNLIYHTVEEAIECWGSFNEIGHKLEEIGLIRCHASYFINPSHINEIKKDVVVINNKNIPISRSKKKDFLIDLRRFM